MPPNSTRRDQLLALLGAFLGLLPLALAVLVTAAPRGDWRALRYLLPVLGIGLFATLAGWLRQRSRAAYDRDRAAGRLRWWRVRP
ncbi:hypothetical protein ACL02O_23125 [Micromonospora sp. MS34]|uniref:hypothetical protein n=1 Tax=Micromonospora sp. MS34 TaxID=3385971 RepID=UPI0039A03AA8